MAADGVDTEAADTATREQYALLADLCRSTDVTTHAKRCLNRLGLGHGVYDEEDLVATAYLKVVGRIASRGPIDDGRPSPVRRYLFKVISNCAVDLLRAANAQPHPASLDEVATEPSTGTDLDGHLASFDTWDEARRAAQAALPDRQPWVTAAVLTHLTIDEEPDRQLPGHLRLPLQPSDGQVANWASLQYSGRSDCFEEPDTPTIQKRRSTAIKNVRAALATTLATAWELPGFVTRADASNVSSSGNAPGPSGATSRRTKQ